VASVPPRTHELDSLHRISFFLMSFKVTHIMLLSAIISTTIVAWTFGIQTTSSPTRAVKQHGDTWEEFVDRIPNIYKEECMRVLRGEDGGFAQAKQDWYLYHNYFKHVPWGGGFYIDVGANEAEKISSTLFFDKCLGWEGLCIEMQPDLADKLRSKRSCQVVQTCVSSDDTTSFRIDGVGAGAHITRASATEGGLRCATLDSILEIARVKRAEFVSMDIEGQERNALRCFPFAKFDIRVWIIETNKSPTESRVIDLIMLRNGYIMSQLLLNTKPGYDIGRGGFLDTVYERRGSVHVLPGGTPLQTSTDEKFKALTPFSEAARHSWRVQGIARFEHAEMPWARCIDDQHDVNADFGEPERRVAARFGHTSPLHRK